MGKNGSQQRVTGWLGLFRVFDVAFFVPGALLFGALWLAPPEWLGRALTRSTPLQLPRQIRGVLAGLIGISVIFTFGILCHAVVRLVRSALKLFQETKHNDHIPSGISSYLWNLSSLAWSTAVALIIIVLIASVRHRFAWVELGVLVAAAVLVYAGHDFRDGARWAWKEENPASGRGKNGEPAPPQHLDDRKNMS